MRGENATTQQGTLKPDSDNNYKEITRHRQYAKVQCETTQERRIKYYPIVPFSYIYMQNTVSNRRYIYYYCVNSERIINFVYKSLIYFLRVIYYKQTIFTLRSLFIKHQSTRACRDSMNEPTFSFFEYTKDRNPYLVPKIFDTGLDCLLFLSIIKCQSGKIHNKMLLLHL